MHLALADDFFVTKDLSELAAKTLAFALPPTGTCSIRSDRTERELRACVRKLAPPATPQPRRTHPLPQSHSQHMPLTVKQEQHCNQPHKQQLAAAENADTNSNISSSSSLAVQQDHADQHAVSNAAAASVRDGAVIAAIHSSSCANSRNSSTPGSAADHIVGALQPSVCAAEAECHSRATSSAADTAVAVVGSDRWEDEKCDTSKISSELMAEAAAAVAKLDDPDSQLLPRYIKFMRPYMGDAAAVFVPILLADCLVRKGHGGRQQGPDLLVNPSGLSSKKAQRIMSNRGSAARAKLKDKLKVQLPEVQKRMERMGVKAPKSSQLGSPSDIIDSVIELFKQHPIQAKPQQRPVYVPPAMPKLDVISAAAAAAVKVADKSNGQRQQRSVLRATAKAAAPTQQQPAKPKSAMKATAAQQAGPATEKKRRTAATVEAAASPAAETAAKKLKTDSTAATAATATAVKSNSRPVVVLVAQQQKAEPPASAAIAGIDNNSNTSSSVGAEAKPKLKRKITIKNSTPAVHTGFKAVLGTVCGGITKLRTCATQQRQQQQPKPMAAVVYKRSGGGSSSTPSAADQSNKAKAAAAVTARMTTFASNSVKDVEPVQGLLLLRLAPGITKPQPQAGSDLSGPDSSLALQPDQMVQGLAEAQAGPDSRRDLRLGMLNHHSAAAVKAMAQAECQAGPETPQDQCQAVTDHQTTMNLSSYSCTAAAAPAATPCQNGRQLQNGTATDSSIGSVAAAAAAYSSQRLYRGGCSDADCMTGVQCGYIPSVTGAMNGYGGRHAHRAATLGSSNAAPMRDWQQQHGETCAAAAAAGLGTSSRGVWQMLPQLLPNSSRHCWQGATAWQQQQQQLISKPPLECDEQLSTDSYSCEGSSNSSRCDAGSSSDNHTEEYSNKPAAAAGVVAAVYETDMAAAEASVTAFITASSAADAIATFAPEVPHAMHHNTHIQQQQHWQQRGPDQSQQTLDSSVARSSQVTYTPPVATVATTAQPSLHWQPADGVAQAVAPKVKAECGANTTYQPAPASSAWQRNSGYVNHQAMQCAEPSAAAVAAWPVAGLGFSYQPQYNNAQQAYMEAGNGARYGSSQGLMGMERQQQQLAPMTQAVYGHAARLSAMPDSMLHAGMTHQSGADYVIQMTHHQPAGDYVMPCDQPGGGYVMMTNNDGGYVSNECVNGVTGSAASAYVCGMHDEYATSAAHVNSNVQACSGNSSRRSSSSTSNVADAAATFDAAAIAADIADDVITQITAAAGCSTSCSASDSAVICDYDNDGDRVMFSHPSMGLRDREGSCMGALLIDASVHL